MKETVSVAVDKEIVDLAERFLSNRRNQKWQWREAVADGNVDLLRRLGHDLKGTAGAFGFSGLRDLAGELEKEVAVGDLKRAADTLERMIDILDCTGVVAA